MKFYWAVTAAVVAMLAITPAAFAEWDLNWYVDGIAGSTNTIQWDPGTGLEDAPVGGAVYLMWDGGDGIIGDGTNAIDPLTGNVLGNDTVVLLDSSGLARTTIGSDIPVFYNLDAGEFNAFQTISEAFRTGNLYAIAFSAWVDYSTATNTFLGNAAFGVSGVTGFVPDAGQTQTLDLGASAWNLDDGQLIPEPATVAMMIAGIGGMMAYRRKRKTQA